MRGQAERRQALPLLLSLLFLYSITLYAIAPFLPCNRTSGFSFLMVFSPAAFKGQLSRSLTPWRTRTTLGTQRLGFCRLEVSGVWKRIRAGRGLPAARRGEVEAGALEPGPRAQAARPRARRRGWFGRGGGAPKGGARSRVFFCTSAKALLVKFPSAQWQLMS